MTIPLPTLQLAERDYPALQCSANARSVYGHALVAERQAVESHTQGDESAATKVICARIVGWLLLHPFGDTPAPFVLEFVNMWGDFNAKVYELGELYMQYVIPLFKQHKPASLTFSSPPTRSSFERLRNAIDQQVVPSPRDHKHAKAQALIRDRYRCKLSNRLDSASFGAGLVEMTPQDTETFATHCAHIFPESLGFLEGRDPEAKKNYLVTAYTMLNKFGCTNIQQELTGVNIHRLENVMTLEVNVHYHFDKLLVWLEAVEGRPHTYRIVTQKPYFGNFPDEVTFTSPHAHLPQPSPRYLRVHAACCRIAHMSGAAEYIDKIYRDEEELGVLSEDGTSAPVLAHFLQRLVEPG
ncbi:hypothetical protein K466DRAFT_590014 [Polyporus arcularius HHB13444]|uniref:HNH nuclease domain-containing protein n=1 Tax=Polyporus arcularius HHB13444 TaxID=1314778 RepID=A0A5C3P0A7_9APHY|nr:hypothetical protein K466DRAFT_590014 [Polyporus arcularius HHB13444]